jgi:uncharacterized protein (TIGR02246 family)
MRYAIILVFLAGTVARAAESPSERSGKAEIDQFNQNFLALHLKTDNEGILTLWADDGVDLMPGEAPMIGKPAIAAWLKNIQAKMPDAKVTTQEIEFHDIQVSGDWASEWGNEHQVVKTGEGKTIEGYGKIALILHRDATGDWKIKQEMWNNSPHK